MYIAGAGAVITQYTALERGCQVQIPKKHYQLVSTGINKTKPTDTQLISTVTNRYDNDFLFDQLQDLVNPKFKAWYCREFYRLGKDQVLKLASQARIDGRTPSKLFSHLLKETA